MNFTCNGAIVEIAIRHMVVAGWTGRDATAIRHHIEELAAIGVAPPSATPLYYRVAAALLTQAGRIEAVGPDSSGEVEPMIIQSGGRRWLGLGSDHTDRKLEAHSVALSKQVCAKPCAAEIWDWDSVADHLERIELESWIDEGAGWQPYQAGTLAAIRPLADLMAGAEFEALAQEGAAMMCGTFGAKGGVRPAARFRMQMRDPTSGRSISHDYATATLPEVA
ncbi:DUF2848 domain-containing protein [Paracoccus aestuarii]|uniref:DUF2848 domain-containing protein n=1 Tax=Paracoccus aestuarii TaxID=453842 RepID=A0A419A148_9RHOB|nr:DUF2848 domain-containing protein [Paracoccus aestuarii]RJL06655.1 DUF2848 domain-containing protein [Paracoccus aestuarii]WCR00913.1 DUF2848 domain-containing protein [Paracoccus aestuarii]